MFFLQPPLYAIPGIERFVRLASVRLSGNLKSVSLVCFVNSRVRTLDLSGCEGVKEIVLETLQGAPIVKLSLYGCESVGDGCMETLVGLGSVISELNIGNTKVGIPGIVALQGMGTLSTLYFRGFDETVLSTEGFRAIREMHALNFLDIGETDENGLYDLDFDCMSELKGMKLDHFVFHGIGYLSDVGFSTFEGMPLATLELDGCGNIPSERLIMLLQGKPLQKLFIDFGFSGVQPLTEDCWEILGALPLTDLNFFGCFGVSDRVLSILRNLKLTSLVFLEFRMGWNTITDDGLNFLKDMPLRALKLWGCGTMTRQGISNLIGLPLACLQLTGCLDINDDVMSILKNFPLLVDLHLSPCKTLTDNGFQNLLGLPLVKLRLSDCWEITDASFGLLHRIRSTLCDFKISKCVKITDLGVEKLVDLAKLTSLVLDGCNQSVTNDGIKSLGVLRKLETFCIVRDQSRIYDLRDLVRMTSDIVP